MPVPYETDKLGLNLTGLSESEAVVRAEALMGSHLYNTAASVLRDARQEHGASPDLLIVLGNAYEAGRRYKRATEAYLDALLLDPANLKANLRMAALALMNNNPQEAIKYAETAVAHHGDSAEALVLSADILVGLKSPEQATWRYRAALEQDPQLHESRMKLGDLLLSRAREAEKDDIGEEYAEQALKEYDTVLNQVPTSGAAQYGLGRALLFQKIPADAIGPLEKALRLDSKLNGIQLYLGDAYAQIENWAEALRVYKAYPKSDENGDWTYAVARRMAATAAQELEQWEEARYHTGIALAEMDKLDSKNSNGISTTQIAELRSECLYIRAHAEFGLGLTGDAIASVTQSDFQPYAAFAAGIWLWRLGRYPEAWKKLASIVRNEADETGASSRYFYIVYSAHAFTQRYGAAGKILDAALTKHPGDPSLWYRKMAYCLEMHDDNQPRLDSVPSGTATAWQRQLKVNAETSARHRQYWTQEAWAAFSICRSILEDNIAKIDQLLKPPQSEVSEAEHIKGFNEQTRLKRQRATALELLGLAYLDVGLEEAAEKYLTESASVGAQLSGVKVNLGVLYMRCGKAAEALRTFHQALPETQDTFLIRKHIARAKSQLKQFDEAEGELRRLLREAPDNFELLIALAQVLIARSDDLGPEDVAQSLSAYGEAITLLDRVRKLNDTMNAEEFGKRLGSDRLTCKRLAALHYDLGYVRTKVFDTQLQESRGPYRNAQERLLVQAGKDFREAFSKDYEMLAAQNALIRLRSWRPTTIQGLIADKGSLVYAGLILLVLIIQQVMAILGRKPWNDAAIYGSVTLSLLALLAAALYLPNISKLRVAGVQLEKSPVDRSGGAAITVGMLWEGAAERNSQIDVSPPWLDNLPASDLVIRHRDGHSGSWILNQTSTAPEESEKATRTENIRSGAREARGP